MNKYNKPIEELKLLVEDIEQELDKLNYLSLLEDYKILLPNLSYPKEFEELVQFKETRVKVCLPFVEEINIRKFLNNYNLFLDAENRDDFIILSLTNLKRT